jgi:hypothetical protein
MSSLLFHGESDIQNMLDSAPNPKPSADEKARFGQLASLYTAFSEGFARHALRGFLQAGSTTFVDPFCGMGTVAEVSRDHPITLTAGDISPFAALAGAFRSSSSTTIRECMAVVEFSANEVSGRSEQEIYSELGAHVASTATTPLADALARPTAEANRVPAIAMFILALSRLHLYRHLVGSNPTWARRPDSAATGAEALRSIRATLETIGRYAEDLSELRPFNRTSVYWSGIESLPIADSSVDVVLTSPPYANRTDYFRHYHPAVELLLDAAHAHERSFREGQIGTPLIKRTTSLHELPESVTRFLESVRTHRSYASERYYYRTYLQYFTDMSRAVQDMRRWLTPGGALLLVVQDSLFKTLYVPTTDLLIDIAEASGLCLAARRDWSVRHSLSALSPHARRSVSNRTPTESAIVLSKSRS